MAEVTVRDLRKGFGETQILKGVDLDVPAGGFCVLVGPSGCGKSTLLRCLAGLEEPDAGSIRIGERDVTRLPPRDRDIAMVFQSYALYPHLTVRDNLAFGLKLRKAKPDEIAARVAEASAQLGLDPLLDRFPRQLSGGQRQRVAMGRAIVRRPDLFLFDEPLSNLDAALRSQVRVEIRKLHDRLGATSVYVTHDQVEAMTLADVMVVLNGGKVEQMGPPLSVYKKPVSRFVAGFLGSPSMSFLDARVGDGGALKLPDDVTLAGPTTSAPAGSTVAVGVRAEDLRLFDASPWRVEIDVVEALGSETYAHGEGPGGRVVIRLPSRTMVKRGEKIGIAADPDALHVFDAKTGASLRLRADGRKRAAGCAAMLAQAPMKPSYDDETLAAFFRPLSPELWDDPIVGPVLRRLEQHDRVLIDAVADVDRSQIRDALARTPGQRLADASSILSELTGWKRVAG